MPSLLGCAVKNYEEIAEAAKKLPDLLPSNELAHVGVGVTPPQPTYTPDPKRSVDPVAHERGIVVLSVIVGADGKVREVHVARSGDPELDEKAVQAVRKWNFKPARKKNGQPVAVQINIEVTFRSE